MATAEPRPHPKTGLDAKRLVPSLCPETWRDIFIFANEDESNAFQIGGEFDVLAPKLANGVIFGWPFDRHAEDKINGTDNSYSEEWETDRHRYLAGFRRKLVFAQLSRMHWDVASELLFKDLQIYNYDALLCIADIASSTTSMTGRAIRSWTKDVRFRLFLKYEAEKDLSESIQQSIIRILSQCPSLHSISVLISPRNRGEMFWPCLMAILMDHIPSNVQRLELNTIDRKLVDLKEFKERQDPTMEPSQLSSLRVDSLCGIHSLAGLKHLYINFPQYTHNPSLWEMDLPCLELLHLGYTASLERQNAELLFSRLPSLRVFEYHYCTLWRWPEDLWTCPTLPPGLRKITIKTFALRDDCRAFMDIFQTDAIERFCRHLSHIFAIGVDNPPGSTQRRPSVKVIFPSREFSYTCIKLIDMFFERAIPLSCFMVKNGITIEFQGGEDGEE